MSLKQAVACNAMSQSDSITATPIIRKTPESEYSGVRKLRENEVSRETVIVAGFGNCGGRHPTDK